MDRIDPELAAWIDAKLDEKLEQFAQIVERAFQRLADRMAALEDRMSSLEACACAW